MAAAPNAALVERARREHLYGPWPHGYVAEELGPGEFWPLNERELSQHFPPEVFLAPGAVGDGSRAARAAARGAMDSTWRERLAVRAPDGALAGLHQGRPLDDATWEMNHSAVHPDHRRRGLFSEMIRRVLAFSDALGFARVVSNHAPGNNAVLIAKLRAGFRLTAWDLTAAEGPGVRLTYFHDPAELAAWEYRNGMATLDAALIRSGHGAMAQLRAQFRAADADG